jgi:hypothetical protein
LQGDEVILRRAGTPASVDTGDQQASAHRRLVVKVCTDPFDMHKDCRRALGDPVSGTPLTRIATAWQGDIRG